MSPRAPTGTLLVTLFDRPELHLIDPFAHPATSTLIHDFSPLLGLLGIAELTPDVFAVVAGNYSVKTSSATPGSFSVWKVDLQQSNPRVSKIADLADAATLNGMAALNSHAVLIADSKLGVVFFLDTDTGKYGVVLDDATIKPVPGATIPIGINDVKALDGYLYFTNTFAGSLVRVKADCETGKAAGPFKTIAKTFSITDDFALAKDGTAFIANGTFSEGGKLMAIKV